MTARNTPPAEKAAPQVTVITVKPQSVVIKTLLPGRTAPTMIAEVRPQVTGIIESRTFNEGAEVKAGSTLYKLNAATYQTTYESARAAVAKAEAGVQTARRNVERNKELVEIKFVSQQAYDDAVTTLRQNEADLAARRPPPRRRGSTLPIPTSSRRFPDASASPASRQALW